ncbi:MAG: class I adenylate-forming enzyme family protein [Bauldia sp.]
MRLEQYLNDSAVRFAKRIAVVAGGREHSYGELARSSNRVAAALAARGIGRGDRVALFMDDNFEAVVCAFAVLKAGAVATPIEPTTDADALARALVRTGAVAIATEARLASVAALATARARAIRLVLLCGGDRATASASCMIFEDIAGGIGPGPELKRAGPASDLALLMSSPGPDGAPAESGLTHAEVIAAAGVTPQEKRAFSAVLSYYGLCQLFATVRAGATLVLATPSALRRALAAQIADDDGAVPALVA